MSGINAGLTVSGGPKIDVKKVDQAKVEFGKRAPLVDTRKPDPVKATMDQISNPPHPREQMRGQRDSRHYNENGKAFRGSEFAGLDNDETD
jgi:hypothetical protein